MKRKRDEEGEAEAGVGKWERLPIMPTIKGDLGTRCRQPRQDYALCLVFFSAS